MKLSSLSVFINGSFVGTVSQGKSGELSFAYDAAYDGVPLSLAMPVSNRKFSHKIVQPYLFGLLPDDYKTRKRMAEDLDVRRDNPFLILSKMGLDCPGAVQFCEEGQEDTIFSQSGRYVAVSDDDIANRLKGIKVAGAPTWHVPNEHWSLGGNQGKFALAYIDGQWHECLGSAATTHIFKNGITGIRHQALNEYICMKVAAACGIPTSDVAFKTFCDEEALVVKRYDRVAAGGVVLRLHQEDFCQTLGVLPDNKYPEYGGPSTPDIIRVLKDTELANDNLRLFTIMLFFNYLIGAPDAHAKNYSMLLQGAKKALMAPLYDVASMLPYAQPHKKIRTAMSIGGKNEVGKLGPNDIRKYSENNELEEYGLDYRECLKITEKLALGVPVALANVISDNADLPGMDELGERLLTSVEDVCRQLLARL